MLATAVALLAACGSDRTTPTASTASSAATDVPSDSQVDRSPSPDLTVSPAPASPEITRIVEIMNGDTPVVVQISTHPRPSDLETWPLEIAVWEIAAREHSVLLREAEGRPGLVLVYLVDADGDCDIAAELEFEAGSFTLVVGAKTDGTVPLEMIEGTSLTGPARTDYTSACSG